VRMGETHWMPRELKQLYAPPTTYSAREWLLALQHYREAIHVPPFLWDVLQACFR